MSVAAFKGLQVPPVGVLKISLEDNLRMEMIPTLEKMTGNVAGEIEIWTLAKCFGLMGKNSFRKLLASSGLDPWIEQPMTKEPWASLSLRDISVTNAASNINGKWKIEKKCHLAEGVSRCVGLSSDVLRPQFLFFNQIHFFEWKLLLGLVIISRFLDNLNVNGVAVVGQRHLRASWCDRADFRFNSDVKLNVCLVFGWKKSRTSKCVWEPKKGDGICQIKRRFLQRHLAAAAVTA